MMEETLIRESANRKAGVRTYNDAPKINKIQPPISFVNTVNQSQEEYESKESIFSFGGENPTAGEDKKTADETSGESNESGKSEENPTMKKKMSLTSPEGMATSP